MALATLSFLLHIKYTLSYRIVSSIDCCRYCYLNVISNTNLVLDAIVVDWMPRIP